MTKYFRIIFLVLAVISCVCILPSDSNSVQEYVTLRDYIDTMFRERTRQLEIKMEASERAVKIASDNLQLELEKLNNLRQEVTKDRGLLVTKDTYDGDIKAVNVGLQELKERYGSLETRITTWITAMGVFFVIVQIVLNYLNRKALMAKSDIK